MYRNLLLPDLKEMLEQHDAEGLREFCEALYPAVAAEVLEDIEPAQAWEVLSHCSVERQAEIFEFMELPLQVALVDVIDRKPLSKLIEVMSPDDRVDLLGRMDPEHVENLLPLIAQAERSDIRKLLSYPEDSAGAVMTTEYASLTEGITVQDALQRLRVQAPDRETIYYIYVLDEGRRLQGVVTLRELILARPGSSIDQITKKDVISVRVDDDQEFVAQELGRYAFLAIPVVDNQHQLVGIVTHDDVIQVMQEEASEDAHRLGAVEPLEDSYISSKVREIVWKRGVWLVPLMGAAFVTASVLERYEDLLAVWIWMSPFLPLVMASGGNAGSQSATLIIRAIAAEKLDAGDLRHLLFRELFVAVGLASALMLLAALGASCFVSPHQALVISSTVFTVVFLGAITGTILPMLLQKAGVDPAMMSNPLIASIVDVMGVIIYFTMAMWIMGQPKLH